MAYKSCLIRRGSIEVGFRDYTQTITMPGKSVLITGCSDGGLGSALALAFHKRGYRVVASARNVAKMGQMKAAGIETVTLDVQSEESIKEAVAEVTKVLGGQLDFLVNNAGAGYSMPIMDIKQDQLKNIFDLNVFSLVSVTQGFLPLLRKAGGTVVNNTSVAGTVTGGVPIQSAYNATKAAAIVITNNLRLELKPFGVKVIDLRTAAVKTQFFQNAGTANLPADSIYQPAKDAICYFMEGGDLMTNAMAAETWASRVVGDLSKSSPPLVIWRGTQATQLWLLSFFPIHWFDPVIKNVVGLSVLDKRLKEQGRLKQI
ncbi:hypothetical protein AMS68_007661 [Peltaster fructicola]|uniref:Uncharacterized protein n=1 Tax=Peltaster fructicola TaxID=286661 RepID=A0A6H0Y551_9PEZI|nr:hypothetical protein AMS68_007661 [Peltaster fructicola]